MKYKLPGVTTTIRGAWDTLSKVPGGRVLFSKLVGQMAPYSGTTGAVVEELGPGKAKVTLRDRRKVRNHLRSIHAIALVNLAELTSGLAMMYGIPDDARGILRAFSIEYHKKSRGFLEAACDFQPPRTNAKQDYLVDVSIYNCDKEVVATAKATWRIGPLERSDNDAS